MSDILLVLPPVQRLAGGECRYGGEEEEEVCRLLHGGGSVVLAPATTAVSNHCTTAVAVITLQVWLALLHPGLQCH